MKRFGSVMFVLLILYVIVYDLKVGTLPAAAPKPVLAEQKAEEHVLITIKPGETVLSIFETRSSGRNLDIAKALNEFKRLNPDTNPDRILPGKTYKFPLSEKDKQ